MTKLMGLCVMSVQHPTPKISITEKTDKNVTQKEFCNNVSVQK